MSDYQYEGQELDSFAHAQNWKNYWSSCVLPSISGDVLEVGAGIGVNTPILVSNAVGSWTCLEPDPELAGRAQAALQNNPKTTACEVVVGTTASVLPSGRQFDTLVYIDVLEHIPEDADELKTAARLLRRGGKLVVLSPAHQWLYSPFDKAIGHCGPAHHQAAPCKLCGTWT